MGERRVWRKGSRERGSDLSHPNPQDVTELPSDSQWQLHRADVIPSDSSVVPLEKKKNPALKHPALTQCDRPTWICTLVTLHRARC